MSATVTPKMPAFSTSAAMALLWQKAQREMSLPELEWLASGIPEHIGFVTLSLAEVLSGLGCLIGADESSGSLSNKEDVSQLMHSLSHQLDTISGLASIADEAGFLAMQALKEYQS
jgi:hypothetical protein